MISSFSFQGIYSREQNYLMYFNKVVIKFYEIIVILLKIIKKKGGKRKIKYEF